MPRGTAPRCSRACFAAAAADDARACTTRARIAVRGEAGLVRLGALPQDVRRQMVADQDQAILGSSDRLARVRSPRLFLPRIEGPMGPMAEPIGAGIARMPQQVLEGIAVGPPPFQPALIRTAGRVDRDADAVMHPVAKQAVHRRLAVELVKDQAHDRLHLLVRVDGPIRRRACEWSRSAESRTTRRASPCSACPETSAV